MAHAGTGRARTDMGYKTGAHGRCDESQEYRGASSDHSGRPQGLLEIVVLNVSSYTGLPYRNEPFSLAHAASRMVGGGWLVLVMDGV